jgi:hypothetical protein
MRTTVSALPPPPLIPPIGALPALPLIRRAAFVVPTWPRDFSFTKALLDSYAAQSLSLHADLILVFSFGKKTLRPLIYHLVMRLLRKQESSPLFTLESGS